MKEEKELVLFPNKDGSVADLMHEAREQIEVECPEVGKLRLLEIISAKVLNVVSNDLPLDHLATNHTLRTFRIEVGFSCLSQHCTMRNIISGVNYLEL